MNEFRRLAAKMDQHMQQLSVVGQFEILVLNYETVLTDKFAARSSRAAAALKPVR